MSPSDAFMRANELSQIDETRRQMLSLEVKGVAWEAEGRTLLQKTYVHMGNARQRMGISNIRTR